MILSLFSIRSKVDGQFKVQTEEGLLEKVEQTLQEAPLHQKVEFLFTSAQKPQLGAVLRIGEKGSCPFKPDKKILIVFDPLEEESSEPEKREEEATSPRYNVSLMVSEQKSGDGWRICRKHDKSFLLRSQWEESDRDSYLAQIEKGEVLFGELVEEINPASQEGRGFSLLSSEASKKLREIVARSFEEKHPTPEQVSISRKERTITRLQ